MDSSLVHRIQNLDTDLQQKIMSYTYSVQPDGLLRDIRDYNYSLETTQLYYFKKYMIEVEDFHYKTDLNYFLDDIFEYITHNIFKIHYYDFWRRLFVFRDANEDTIQKYVSTTFYETKIEAQIKILWGLLTPEERGDVRYFGMELFDSDSEHEEDELVDDDFDY